MDGGTTRRHLWFGWLMFLALVGLLTLGLVYFSRHHPTIQKIQPGYYQVVKFDDGDTIVVDMNRTNETVRFIGVDTPETHKPKTPVQCYGPEASAFTKQLIGDQPVRLQADPLDTNRDRYGRLLRYVYLPDGTLLDQKIIEDGYGFAYTYFPFEKKSQFIEAQKTAKENKLGLWQACEVIKVSGGYRSPPAAQ